MAQIRCYSDNQEGKSDILKGLARFPLQPRTQDLSSFGEKTLGAWSHDLLKSNRFLIKYLGFLYDNHTKSKL